MGWKICGFSSRNSSILKLKIAITGASGFIGSHLVDKLISNNNNELLIVGRNVNELKIYFSNNRCVFIELDLNENLTNESLNEISKCDKLIHLAWAGLPNYTSFSHFNLNLNQHFYFLSELIKRGLTDITVTGTCFEYGKVEGCLTEDMIPKPNNFYALAKVTLMNLLLIFKNEFEFKLKWVRLFYIYGDGESNKSLFSLLEKAISTNKKQFDLSPGDQIRDYLTVDEVVNKLIAISLNNDFDGVINCSSGIGLKIKDIVVDYVEQKGAKIQLNFGVLPYNSFESFSFWGDTTLYNKVINH